MNSYLEENALEILMDCVERVVVLDDSIERRGITLLDTEKLKTILFLKRQISKIGSFRIKITGYAIRIKLIKALRCLFGTSLRVSNEWSKTNDICIYCMPMEVPRVRRLLTDLVIIFKEVTV